MKTLNISKESPRWLYEALRALERNSRTAITGLTSIDRGESPFGGGNPIAGVTDHGQLTGLFPDDDHLQYALLRGRVGGQTLNGSIDLSSTSDSFPWASASRVLISASDTPAGTSSNRVINTDVPVANIVVLSLSTHSPGAGYGAGTTNYHTSITDSKGNTWQKLGEHTTSFFAGVEEQTNSLWICLVTVAMTTAGSDSLTFNFANSFAMKAVESHQFIGTAGLTFTVAGTTTGGAADTDPGALTLSGLTSREYLFVRGCAIHYTDDATRFQYTPTALYTEFTSDHSNSSTLASVGGNRGISSRGEFHVLTATGDTSNPAVNPAGFPDDASLMVAIAITSSVVGDLILKSIDKEGAAKIHLHDTEISAHFDQFSFYSATGLSVNSYIRGSDGAFVGPVVPTVFDVPDNVFRVIGSSDISKKLAFEVDGITPATTRTLTVPDVSGTIILSQGTSAGQVIGLSAHSGGSASSLAIEGAVLIGALSTSFTSGRVLNVQDGLITGGFTFINFQQTLNSGTTGAASTGTYTNLQIAISGTPAWTSGSPNLRAFFITCSPVTPAGVSFQTVSGGIFQVAPSETAGTGGHVANATGLQVLARLPNNLGSSGLTATSLYGLELKISNRLKPVTDAFGVIVQQDVASTGAVNNFYGYALGNTSSAALPMNSASVTNWKGFYLEDTGVITTNAWGLWIGASLKNVISGTLRVGSVTDPSHRLDIAAGTTTIAPIRLASGVSLTTPVLGVIEFTDPDIFISITDTTVQRKAFVLDDGTRLTAGRVPFAGTNGRLVDDADLTFSVDTLSATKVAMSSLTSGRIPIVSTAGLLIDDADFTFAVDTLTVTKIAATELVGNLTIADAINIITNATTGTKFATAASQKLSFWGVAPIAQPTLAIAAATFVANTSAIADDSATFDGYTLGQVVKALRNAGLLA